MTGKSSFVRTFARTSSGGSDVDNEMMSETNVRGIGELAREQLFRVLLNGNITRVKKPWGFEYIVATNDFLLKVIEVFAGQRTSLQHHNQKTEIHWLLAGSGELYKDEPDQDERELYQVKSEMRPSPGLLVQPGEVHRAIGPLLILEISTNHPDDVVRHADDYAREDVDAG